MTQLGYQKLHILGLKVELTLQKIVWTHLQIKKKKSDSKYACTVGHFTIPKAPLLLVIEVHKSEISEKLDQN